MNEDFGKIIAQWAYDVWQSDEMRIVLSFDTLSQSEQDRIFNELEVGGVGLFMLHCEEEERQYLQKEIIENFLSVLKSTGIENTYIEQWKMLIEMRYAEYKRDYESAHDIAAQWEELQNDHVLHSTWARIETIAINVSDHIRRGALEEDDPMLPILRKWLIVLDTAYTKLLKPQQKIKTHITRKRVD